MTPVSHTVEAIIRAFGTAMSEFASSLMANAALAAALWSAAGAIASVPLLIYIWRNSFLRRSPAVWNVLAKTSYLLVFAVVTLGSGSIGALRDTQYRFHATIAKELQPALTTEMPLIRQYVATRISKLSPEQRSAKDVVATLIGELQYIPASDSLWEKLKASCVDWLLHKFGTELLIDQFQKILIRKLEAAAAALRTDIHGQAQGQLVQLGADLLVKLGTDATRQVQFTMLDKTVPQAVVEVVGNTADGYFRSAYKLIAIIAGVISAIILAEMRVYFRWYLPKRGRALAQPRQA
jgi:hypothetical protein